MWSVTKNARYCPHHSVTFTNVATFFPEIRKNCGLEKEQKQNKSPVLKNLFPLADVQQIRPPGPAQAPARAFSLCREAQTHGNGGFQGG